MTKVSSIAWMHGCGGVEHGGYVRYVNMKTSICMSPIEEKGGTIPQKLSFHTLQNPRENRM